MHLLRHAHVPSSWLTSHTHPRTLQGIYGSDEAAQKAACCEIRSMNALSALGLHQLHTTLTAVFRLAGGGHVVVATAEAPIDSRTLVCGTADAGVTYRDDSAPLRSLLAHAASQLNLCRHELRTHPQPQALAALAADSDAKGDAKGDAKAADAKAGDAKAGAKQGGYHFYSYDCYVGADVEGHVGRDGRCYLVDLARLLPPTPPRPKTTDHLVFLFRPEFLR